MKKVIITGMPRSGTSWLGQIFNSSPEVLFRTEPLFSYAFKNAIGVHSTPRELQEFFTSLESSIEDDFILQKENLRRGFYPDFRKTNPCHLAFKTTRHHELLERYLTCLEDLNIVAIVRHPCGSINSWINSYREFHKKGCTIADDWRSGMCRKGEIGEYWGFDDWLRITRKFIELQQRFSNFHLIRYIDLVDDTIAMTRDLFARVGIPFSRQTHDFLIASAARHDADPYSVFKDKAVKDKWKGELPADVANEIIRDTKAKGLETFLE